MQFESLGRVTWIVRAGIYLAFAFSILMLLYLAGSFIYSLTHADDFNANLATNVYVMPELKESAGRSIYDSRNGAVRFRLDETYGVFTWLNMPRDIIFAVYFHLLLLWFLFFIGVRELANLFEDVGAGRPFVRENARRLRVIGYCMAGGGLFNAIFKIVSYFVFYEDVMIPGARIPWKLFMLEDLNLGLIFGGFIVLAVSEVFRIGNRLQEETELTV